MRPFVFASLALLLFTLQAQAQPGGKMVFAQPEYDFGRVEEGMVAEHVFVFTNEGTEPLSLLHVNASCGCTTPEWTKTPVAPGEQGRVVVRYDSKNRPGAFRKSIRVVATGQEKAVTLYITGDVGPAIVTGVPQGNVVLDAESWDFGAVTAGAAVQHTFKFQNNGTRPLRITRVDAPAGVTVELPDKPIFTGETIRLTIKLDGASLKAGQAFDYTVTLATTDDQQPNKTIRLTGNVGTR